MNEAMILKGVKGIGVGAYFGAGQIAIVASDMDTLALAWKELFPAFTLKHELAQAVVLLSGQEAIFRECTVVKTQQASVASPSGSAG